MDDQPKLQPYGDVTTITGKYMKEGKERNRYQKIGTLFATPNFSRITIKLDAAPIGGDGWLSVFKRERNDQRQASDSTDSVVTDTDSSMSLDDIPF